MGHQVLLIARVKARGSNSATYRQVAGYYHQYCYGSVPLKASLRLFALLEQPDNADVIREEVRALDGQYGEPGKEPLGPDLPCRFLSTLLGSCWDVFRDDTELEIGGTYLHASLLSANMGFWDGHNSDGLTVIDVTNPQSPACSFEHRNIKPRTPLEYLTAYYPDEVGPNPRPIEQCRTTTLRSVGIRMERVIEFTDEELVARRAARRTFLLAIVDSFRDIPPLTEEILTQAWPATFRSRAKPKDKLATALRNMYNPDDRNDKNASDDTGIPSLVDISLPEAIKGAIKTGDFTQFKEAVWFSHKLDIIADTLRDYAIFPDAATPLLSQLIQGWKRNNAVSVDLSGFNLSDSQLAAILPELDDVRTISLSNNPSITIVSLELVLEQLPHLRRLFIMRCSGITDQDFEILWLTKQKLFGKLDALYHPMLLGNLCLPPPITLVSMKRFEFNTTATSPMIASPAVVVQSLIDLWDIFDPKYFMHTRGRVYEVVWVTPRAPGQTWDQRGIACSHWGFPWSTIRTTFSSWFVIVRPESGPMGPPAWAFVPYTFTVAKKAADEGSPGARPRKTEPSVEVGEIHSLQEYLQKVVEEEGKIPAPQALMSTLEAQTKRLGVELLKKETVMGCLFGAK